MGRETRNSRNLGHHVYFSNSTFFLEFLLKHQNAMEEEYLPSDIFELPPDSPEELALASITPLLGTFLKPISETCKSQSMTYLSALFSGEDWAQKSKSLD